MTPTFLKEDFSAKKQLAQMKELLPKVAGRNRARLENDIRIAKAGIDGENRVTQLINKILLDGKRSQSEMESIARYWLDHHVEKSVDVASQYAIASDGGVASDVSVCPKCGTPMVRRTAKKGERAGKPFWGCSNYPKCRGIVNIAE